MSLGQQIKEARKQNGLTQVALADMLDVAQQTVHYWEKNRSSPRGRTLNKVQEVLNIKPKLPEIREMKNYKVSVRATYYDDLVIEADSKEEAYRIAVQEFKPTSDNLFSIDVYGLSPWEPDGDPHIVGKYKEEKGMM